QRLAERRVQRRVRLLAEERDELVVDELERLLPQPAHLDHLAERLDERREEMDEQPGERRDPRARRAGDATRVLGDRGAPLEPVPAEVEDREGLELRSAIEQERDRARE